MGKCATALQRLSFRWWRCVRRRCGTEDERIVHNAMRAMADELRAVGLAVRDAEVTPDGYVRVRAAIDGLEQEQAYRTTCAKVYRMCQELPIERLFARIEPLEPLDHLWALRNDMPEHALCGRTSACISCETSMPTAWVFGRAALRGMRQRSRERVRTYVDTDGSHVRLKGFICPQCLRKSGFIFLALPGEE